VTFRILTNRSDVRIADVDRHACILDTGEELYIGPEDLYVLCRQIRDEGVEVTVRTWWTKVGDDMRHDLHEVHRTTSQPPAEPEKSDGIF
jgi:hypothetical protein